jgi:hypothetical protein
MAPSIMRKLSSDETKAIAPNFPPRPIRQSFKKILISAAINGANRTIQMFDPIPIKVPQKIIGRFKALILLSKGQKRRGTMELERAEGVPRYSDRPKQQ